MKRVVTFSLVLGLATVSSSVLAEQRDQRPRNHQAGPQPVQMSDAQLDSVAAGQISITEGLVAVEVGDVTVLQDVRILNNSVNDLTVQIPVAATVGAAVAVLGNAAAVAQQFGRQN